MDVVVFFAIIHLGLLRCLLLVGNSLLATLAGTSVVLGALAPDGESETMTDSTVAADVHKALDVHLDGRTEFTFNLVVLIDFTTDLGDLLVVPVTNFDGAIDTALLKNLLG